MNIKQLFRQLAVSGLLSLALIGGFFWIQDPNILLGNTFLCSSLHIFNWTN